MQFHFMSCDKDLENTVLKFYGSCFHDKTKEKKKKKNEVDKKLRWTAWGKTRSRVKAWK